VIAAQGHTSQALVLLREAVDHGLRPANALNMEQDTDLKSLRGNSSFEALVAYVKKRAAPSQTDAVAKKRQTALTPSKTTIYYPPVFTVNSTLDAFTATQCRHVSGALPKGTAFEKPQSTEKT
jgi:hypothetical protein